jgi:hypothetical protein
VATTETRRGASTETPAEAPAEASAETVGTLGRLGRSWRVALLLTLTGLFLAGSLRGNDISWPFGPWRMFSTSQAPTGAVVAMAIQAETADGQWFDAPLSPSNVGLNRAEVEGQIPQITRDPAMLGTLAKSHSRLRPHAPAWIGVRVVRRATVIVNRVPTGAIDSTVVATWTTHGVSTGGPLG